MQRPFAAAAIAAACVLALAGCQSPGKTALAIGAKVGNVLAQPLCADLSGDAALDTLCLDLSGAVLTYAQSKLNGSTGY